MAAGISSELRARLRAIEGGGRALGQEVASLGGALDAALPWRGLPYRALHEVGGAAASAWAAVIAASALRRGGVLVWCGSTATTRQLGLPYGPGLARYGIPADRLWLVRAADQRAVLWALEAALRTPGVACAVAELTRLSLNAGRRLQLAAEAGGGMGIALRLGPPDLQPSAAVTRWRAEAGPHPAPGLELAAWRIKGAAPWHGRVRLDDPALPLPVAAPLAGRADAPRPAASCAAA